MTDTETPAAPSDLGERGAAFWQSAVTAFELSDTELELLVECCRLLDEVESLRHAVTRDGVTVLGSTKQPRVHPALAQLLAHRLALGKLLSQLALPGVDDEPLARPLQAAARRGAEARWRGHQLRGAAVGTVPVASA